MQIKSKLKFARISPQKVRLIANQIRGQLVGKAVNNLTFSSKKGALMLKKVLESAIANAENNYGADVDELNVARVSIDEGPVIKRTHARAKGRSVKIFKRMSHISVILTEK